MQNNPKSREFDNVFSQNSCRDQVTIMGAQDVSEEDNFEKKPTLAKTDSSHCYDITPKNVECTVKDFIVFFTIIFAITGPFVLLLAPVSLIFVHYYVKSTTFAWIIITCFFLTPLLMIICGCKMWISYSRQKYKKSIIYGLIPLFFLIFLFICNCDHR